MSKVKMGVPSMGVPEQPGDLAGKLRKPGEPSSMAKSVGLGHMYSVFAWKNMLQSTIGVLRARMLNLADSSTDDKEQRAAMKGLIKDFFNQAYYPLLSDITGFLVDYNVLPEDVLTLGNNGSDELKMYEERG